MSKTCKILTLLSPITILLVCSWFGGVRSIEYGLGNPFGMGQWQGFPFNMPQYPPYFQQLFFPNWGYQPSFFPQIPAVIVSQVEQVMDYLIDATSLDPDQTDEEGYDDEEYEEEEEEEEPTTTTTTTTKKPTTPKKKRPRGK